MKSGIYLIRNKIDGKIYVGQSVNIKARITAHKRKLKINKHGNDYLQKAFNKYGADNFEFKVIENCNMEELDNKEIYWIKKFNSINRNFGYNLESGGHQGKITCLESKLAKCGEKNPMFGKKHSLEFVEKIKMLNRGNSDKLTVKDVEEIKNKLYSGIRQIELSKEYNVTISTINKIARCKNWQWLNSELNKKIISIEEDKRKELKKSKQKKAEAIIQDKLNKEKIKKLVLEDYKNKLPKSEILKKYKLANTSYIRIISEEYNRNKKEIFEKVILLKSKGMLNKEIAEEMKLHRTTITEILKKSILDNANTEGNNI